MTSQAPSADCPRFGRLIGGCKFEGRYDTGPASLSFDYRGQRLAELVEATKPQTYVRDVCRRCGRTVERAGR